MKYLSLLLLLFMCCSTFTPQTTVTLTNPSWFIVCAEEWRGYKEEYIQTTVEVHVTGIVENTGTSTAKDVYLVVQMDKVQGEVLIIHRIEAGVKHDFAVMYEYQHTQQGAELPSVNLDIKWR